MSENVKQCSRCGKDVVWGYTPKNKAPMKFDYRKTFFMDENGTVRWGRVSHFVTCGVTRKVDAEKKLK